MNHITKLLSVLMMISFGFSIDNEESETTSIDKSSIVELGTEQSSGAVSQDRTVAPIDVEKIKNIRIGKEKAERSRAKALIQKHKKPKVDNSKVVNPNFEKPSVENEIKSQIRENSKISFIEKITQSLRKKYTVQTLESEDGERAIKFPTDSGTN